MMTESVQPPCQLGLTDWVWFWVWVWVWVWVLSRSGLCALTTAGTNLLLCLQLRRAGAMAVTKAVAGKDKFESLNLDANAISEAAVDDIKVILCSACVTLRGRAGCMMPCTALCMT